MIVAHAYAVTANLIPPHHWSELIPRTGKIYPPWFSAFCHGGVCREEKEEEEEEERAKRREEDTEKEEVFAVDA